MVRFVHDHRVSKLGLSGVNVSINIQAAQLPCNSTQKNPMPNTGGAPAPVRENVFHWTLNN